MIPRSRYILTARQSSLSNATLEHDARHNGDDGEQRRSTLDRCAHAWRHGVFVVGQDAERHDDDDDDDDDDFDNIDGAKDVDESDGIGARRASARGCEESAAERDRTARARGEGER